MLTNERLVFLPTGVYYGISGELYGWETIWWPIMNYVPQFGMYQKAMIFSKEMSPKGISHGKLANKEARRDLNLSKACSKALHVSEKWPGSLALEKQTRC